jgi:hypothetical protein
MEENNHVSTKSAPAHFNKFSLNFESEDLNVEWMH